MLAKLLPSACSRLSVFVSYAHEQRAVGEEIAQALKNAGHEVFFDLDSIPAAGDYNQRIRGAIGRADRLVFLASRESLAPGKFTLTELQLAKERWPSPEGKVLPVMIDTRVGIADLPVYLRSVSVMQIAGNAPAEVAGAIERTRGTGLLCRLVSVAAGVMVAGGLAWMAKGGLTPGTRAEVALLPVQVVHFRSVAEAPYPADAPGASTAWVDTPLTITMSPVAYVHRTEPGRRARILGERVELHFAGRVFPYKATYAVEITDQRCGDRWYCIKGNVGPETLEPGRTISRETMFLSETGGGPLWRELVDAILARADLPLQVVLKARIDDGGSSPADGRESQIACGIDIRLLREGMQRQGFRQGARLKPVYLQSPCLPVATK